MYTKEELETIKNSPPYQYAIKATDKDNKNVGRYVKKQCKEFINIINSEEYYIDMLMYECICNFFRLIYIMPNKTAYENLSGFQWFFIINVLCIRRKSNGKRRYELSIMLIARKNGKTLLVALLLLLILLLSEPLSECYSVAPDKELSSAVLKEFRKILNNSPQIARYFKLLRNETRCTINDSYYKPLACSENRLDSRLPVFWIGDEVGALKSNYPLEAMQSGQVTLDEKMGAIISTAYDSLDNPMVENIEYAKKVLDGLIDDDSVFALIYEPDNPNDPLSDVSTYQANPLALDVEVIKDSIFKKRDKAINMPSTLGNYLIKHANIFTDGKILENFISIDDLRLCKIENGSYDWQGKEVYIGLDLSQSDDNTAVTMTCYDLAIEKYVCKSWCFYPADNEDKKIKTEDIPYDRFSNLGYCYPCGGRIIDYGFVEDFILNIIKRYGVTIKNVTYDRYNAISSIQKLEKELPLTEFVEQKQTPPYLHFGTKLLKESILNNNFLYEENTLLEFNFKHAKTYESGGCIAIDKKRATGKIDMIDAAVNCFCSMYSDKVEQTQVTYDSNELFIL